LDLQRRASAAGTGEPWPTNREAIERFLREWGPAADRFYAGINVRTTNGPTVREQIERRWDARELVDLDDEGAHLMRASCANRTWANRNWQSSSRCCSPRGIYGWRM